MKTRYLLLNLAFVCSALADGTRGFETTDLQTILQEARTALKTSAPQDVAANLKIRTYGKQFTVTEAGIRALSEMDDLPLAVAGHFAGLYTLDGNKHPDPSALDPQRVAATLKGLMTHATWRADPEKIGCSGAGLVVLNVKEDRTKLTYNLLATTYTFRRLRLGQLVSLEATISGVSLENGRLEVFGIIRQVEAP
ncbi:MAG: hypothetical protein EHM23_00710 [Acidobacteria bacterium]|nr:MAG: hypothetical protein EHM23_00710 [Acidobacteriota bacterium]